MTDFYIFDEDQRRAIERVEYLLRLRQVKHGWRDYYSHHLTAPKLNNETKLERRPELGKIPDARP